MGLRTLVPRLHMSSWRPAVESLILAALLILILSEGGCALPHGEYRSGLYLHTHPVYSFRVPAGWHPAADTSEFAHVQRRLQWLNEEGRRRYLQREAADFKRVDVWLVSSRGAGIMVTGTPSAVVRFPRGQRLTEREEQGLKDELGKRMQPELTVEKVETAEYGPHTGLRLAATMRGSGIAESVPLTMILLEGSSTGAVLGHFGTPEDDKEGFSDFEELASSFRFE